MAQSKSRSGFTLVELAVVMMVVGIILAGAIVALREWETQRYNDQVETRINSINQALLDYLAMNPSLPCVASYTLPRSDPSYGRATNCAAAVVAGTGIVSVPNPASGNRAVRIGGVPVRDLNLPDEYMADPKGNMFTYAVTEVQVIGPINNMLGAINVQDENGTSVITPPGGGIYALVHHGRDGKGTYSFDGNVPTSLCNSEAGNDQENCDGDVTFMDAPFSTATGASHFDDTIIYSTYVIPNCGLTGEVFDGTSCVPAQGTGRGGWTRNKDGSCRFPNSFTGACTCPPHYSPLPTIEFDNPDCQGGYYTDGFRTTNCGVEMFLCVRE